MAARVGLSRRPVYGGWARGKLEGALDAPTVRSPPRRTKLAPYTPLIEERLVTYPELTAVRLFDEVRAARTRSERPGFSSQPQDAGESDRKSTRLNSSHQIISYAVFCFKKKKKQKA